MLKALQDLRLHTPAVQPPPRAPPHTATASSSPTSLAWRSQTSLTAPPRNVRFPVTVFHVCQPTTSAISHRWQPYCFRLLTVNGKSPGVGYRCVEGWSFSFPHLFGVYPALKEVFEHPAGRKEVGEQLISLRQGRGTAADYALSFRTLAAQTGWPDDPLKLHFRKGLNSELQSELACRMMGKLWTSSLI